MFGKRLVPCFFMGLAIGFALFICSTLALATVPAIGVNTPTVGFAIGLTCATGIGLYKDMTESEAPTPPTSTSTIDIGQNLANALPAMMQILEHKKATEASESASKTPST